QSRRRGEPDLDRTRTSGGGKSAAQSRCPGEQRDRGAGGQAGETETAVAVGLRFLAPRRFHPRTGYRTAIGTDDPAGEHARGRRETASSTRPVTRRGGARTTVRGSASPGKKTARPHRPPSPASSTSAPAAGTAMSSRPAGSERPTRPERLESPETPGAPSP